MSNKRARISLDKAVVDVWQREVGEISARNFVKRLAASQDLVLRLDIYKKLDKHQGCVNTVSFNADGNVLVSGSDDTQVILWDWETGHTKLSFLSGHLNDVLQAKFMPHTDDRSLVTCAADGEANFLFRINLLLESCPVMRKFGFDMLKFWNVESKLGCWLNIRDKLINWPSNQEALIYFILAAKTD